MLQNYILYILFLLYHFSFNVVLFSMKPTGPWSRPTSRSYHRNGWGKVKFFILSKNVLWKRLKRWKGKWPGILSFLSKKEALVGIEELSSDSETTITQQGMQRQQHMSQRKTSSAMASKDQTDTTTGEQQMISSKSEQQVTKVIPKHTHIKILVFLSQKLSTSMQFEVN